MTLPAPAEPPPKRAVVFIDGQNLYHCVREAFGYSYPNYDVLKLVRSGPSTVKLEQDSANDYVRTRWSRS